MYKTPSVKWYNWFSQLDINPVVVKNIESLLAGQVVYFLSSL